MPPAPRSEMAMALVRSGIALLAERHERRPKAPTAEAVADGGDRPIRIKAVGLPAWASKEWAVWSAVIP
ncbi:hypothetical protein [Methylocapsa sp. S129]|uniref:hypothetical protein n=1 Tax=Methylocapsa sp. S129 TaxID=1641869 RepID=UPI00131CDD58|nr:hypothetical protein [Methylocapsa sp. S129]